MGGGENKGRPAPIQINSERRVQYEVVYTTCRFTTFRAVPMATKPVVARTGAKTPVSGQYRPAGSRTEITLSKGDRVPPNNTGKQQRFTLVDKTKHRR